MLKLPAYLTGFSSRADRSAGLRFTTQELDGETFKTLQELNGSFGWLLFQENPFQPSDIPTEAAENPSKTPSKRLRATLYVLWTQQGSQGDFEAFYTERMNKIIDYVKAKLDQ
jgi:hypothetical protein